MSPFSFKQLIPAYVLNDMNERRLGDSCPTGVKAWNYLRKSAMTDPKTLNRGFMTAHTVQGFTFDRSFTVRQFLDERYDANLCNIVVQK